MKDTDTVKRGMGGSSLLCVCESSRAGVRMEVGAPPTWKLHLCETLAADENGGPQTSERRWKKLMILSVSPRPRTTVSCLGSKDF